LLWLKFGASYNAR